MKVTVLIPARMAATRFPGKPLTRVLDKPMIQWVCERSARAAVDGVIVATDSEEIYAAVRAFGGEARMTRSDHPNGTTRIAEVAAELDSEIIVNVQGDEPAIRPEAIREVFRPLLDEPDLEMATLVEPIEDRAAIFDPNVVKAVADARGNALYFSRAPIPFVKHPRMQTIDWPEELGTGHLRHVGIYAYRREFLLRYVAEPPCDLEAIEGLEQLRALYMGARIRLQTSRWPSIGVDTPADVPRAEDRLRNDSGEEVSR